MGKRVSAPTIKVRGLKQAVGLLLLSAAVITALFYVPVTIDGITYNSYLGHRVLKVDDNLEKAVVRPGTRKIDKAFANHKKLTAVVLPDSIKKNTHRRFRKLHCPAERRTARGFRDHRRSGISRLFPAGLRKNPCRRQQHRSCSFQKLLRSGSHRNTRSGQNYRHRMFFKLR